MSIETYIQAQIESNNQAIETMVEQSLVQPGERGVLVTPLAEGTVRVELSYDVPFQEIHWCWGAIISPGES